MGKQANEKSPSAIGVQKSKKSAVSDFAYDRINRTESEFSGPAISGGYDQAGDQLDS
jgi:hypothetical protein